MTGKPYPRALKKELWDAIVNQSRSAQQSRRPVEVPSTIADVPSFDALPEYNQTSVMELAGETLGIANPYFRTHDGLATTTTVIDGKVVLNFSLDFLSLRFNDSTAVLTPSSNVLNCFLTTNSFPGILILISVILFSLSLEFSTLKNVHAP